MTIKRNSSIFFSGALSLIEDKLYLKLQNFSFIHNNISSEKQTEQNLKLFYCLKVAIILIIIGLIVNDFFGYIYRGELSLEDYDNLIVS
jgi:hypothetical protein